MQELLRAGGGPRHPAHSPFLLPSLALAPMGRWESFCPLSSLRASYPKGSDRLRSWGGEENQPKVWPKSKEQETSTLLASAPPSSSAKLQTRDGSSGGGRGAGKRPSLQAQPQV